MELADGSQSSYKSGAAAAEKARVFEDLCVQFPWSLVAVTYSRQFPVPRPKLRDKLIMDVAVLPIQGTVGATTVSYVPRCSSGWARCAPDEVRALIRIPLCWAPEYYTHAAPWSSALIMHPNGSQVLDFPRLLAAYTPRKSSTSKVLFLGEGQADLSAACILSMEERALM
jgi:hypothetical protein